MPHCAGAMTKAPFSIARARSRTSQWSRPVASVKFAGTARSTAPAADISRYSSGKRRSKQMLNPSRTSASWAAPSMTATTLSLAGRGPGGLAIRRPVVDRHVEQVALAVADADLAGRIEQHRRVVRALRIRRALRQAAQQDPRVEAAGELGERLDKRSGELRRRLAQARRGTAVEEHLRQRHELRVLFAGPLHQGRGPLDVRGHVLVRGQLDEGDP